MPAEAGTGRRREGEPVLQAAAVVAVGAAAVAFLAGLGTYLYLRFTQDREPRDGGNASPPR